jgi:arylsulfatase A-like enzyme
MEHAIKVLTQYVVAERTSALSLFWCGEPDFSQHIEGVGSQQAERSLRDSDREFGRLLDWLHETGRESETDVIVLSDHGYSSVKGSLDIGALLFGSGFPTGDKPGGVLSVSNGGAIIFYVHQREQATVDRLAKWLMKQPWCGALVAPSAVGAIDGVLPASLVGADGPRAPDLIMSMAWDSQPTSGDYFGRIYSTNDYRGDHGSLSMQEVNNVMIARGPSFKKGIVSCTPSSNVDVAPTVLRILGLAEGEGMDGRVIEEALAGGLKDSDVKWDTAVHEAIRECEVGTYRQKITVSSVGSALYPDYGTAIMEKG